MKFAWNIRDAHSISLLNDPQENPIKLRNRRKKEKKQSIANFNLSLVIIKVTIFFFFIWGVAHLLSVLQLASVTGRYINKNHFLLMSFFAVSSVLSLFVSDTFFSSSDNKTSNSTLYTERTTTKTAHWKWQIDKRKKITVVLSPNEMWFALNMMPSTTLNHI